MPHESAGSAPGIGIGTKINNLVDVQKGLEIATLGGAKKVYG